MTDKVELKFGKSAVNVAVEHFISYEIDADLYTPTDAFHLNFSDPKIEITAGMRCELFVNGQKELTGIVDVVHRRVSKSGVSLDVEGRDLVGLLVDSYCEKFIDVKGKKLDELAEFLLATVPFINRKEIKYQQNVAGGLGRKAKKKAGRLFDLDEPQKINKIEVGMTVFQVLSQVAMSRGMLFYALPDGTFVFGRPMAKGAPTYSIQLSKSGVGNNVITADFTDNISRRYSKVVVKGMYDSEKMKYPEGVAPDPEFPFYKPYVTKNNFDSMTPQMYAQFIMQKQRKEGRRLIYQVARHSQNGKNWMINELCQVHDEVNGLDGVFLIYGRKFELNKQSGPTTTLTLGVPGKIE